VNDAIYVDDMPRADAAKRIVEEAQRARRKEGKNYEPRFFKFDQNNKFWECALDVIDPYFQKLWDTKDVESSLSSLTINDADGTKSSSKEECAPQEQEQPPSSQQQQQEDEQPNK
jgi:hypothetical protein